MIERVERQSNLLKCCGCGVHPDILYCFLCCCKWLNLLRLGVNTHSTDDDDDDASMMTMMTTLMMNMMMVGVVAVLLMMMMMK